MAQSFCTKNELNHSVFMGVIPISLFLLATGTVLHKAEQHYRPRSTACNQSVRLSTDKQTIKCDGKFANLVCVPTFLVFKPFLR